ncbi:hypothetical protein AUK40_02450 [Candidatus Wirthbacteria bacterium CG2_30_54_11]|uniref:DUF4446 domain-containing protein n=1 Tax=Candidatus Wirthbacteria bacterium CG2_30_54_11 TaxID=1817892 RepID=A0A1J5IMA2_9BACT|nr:MAG: hypothetical protein AUK40_02450 [Candidatus Wirthbacteria bacterium CG2_30_54_11]
MTSVLAAVAILAFALALFAVLGVLKTWQQIRAWNRIIEHLGEGVQGENLGHRLDRLFVKLDQVSFNFNQMGQLQQELREKMRFGVQKKAIVRFNPFEDTGGDQSFALALLDENDDGVVLSSLHARDATRVYAKPVEKGKSRYQLTDEEKQVLSTALGKK